MLQEAYPANGTLITADIQHAGRGQRERSWHSHAGQDITCSYILRPAFLSADRQFMLGAAVALAVHGMVAECSPHLEEVISIKWPNDILVRNRKVAGILIENTLRGMQLDSSIVGIGINVNGSGFPEGVKATSIAEMLGKEVGLEAALTVLDRHMGVQYGRLAALRFSEIMSGYNSLLFARSKNVVLDVNGMAMSVKVLGAQESGLLNLLHPDGRVTEHAHHELGWAEALTGH